MTPAVRKSMQVPRPTALHRGGRSRAQTCAGTFFEFPAHPSAIILQAEPPLGHPSALRHYSAVAPTSFTIFAQNSVWFLRKVANSSGDLLVTISAPPFAMRLTTSGSSIVLIITA